MMVSIRDASPDDAPDVVCLIGELASAEGESSPLTEAYVHDFLTAPQCYLLVAEIEGQIVGLLSYSIRPDLYHAAPSAMINELIVSAPHRSRGVGSLLLSELMERLEAIGCAEVSVTTMAANTGAQRFYRSHGLTDEALFLEKHFARSS